MPHLTRYSGKCRLFCVMRLPCSVTRWKEHLYTIPRQLKAGTKNSCQNDWVPGLDMKQISTEHKTRDQTTRLWSPLSCCAAHTCSAVQRSWIRRSDELMSAVSYSLLYTSRQPQPLDAATSPLLHPKNERDPVWESLLLLTQTLTFRCLNNRRWAKC